MRYLVLLILFIAAVVLSLFYQIDMGEVCVKGSTDNLIFTSLRVPRTLLCFAVGGLLSWCGMALQNLFRNPLVEPYTLGISGGAMSGVALSVALGLKAVACVGILFASSGALAASAIVYYVYILSGKRISRLLLSGIMVAFACSAFTTLIISVLSPNEMQMVMQWQFGGFEVSEWWQSRVALILFLILLVVSPFMGRWLNVLTLGAEEATYLGVNVFALVSVIFVVTSLVTAFSVGVVGIIAFVGMVVPQFVRKFYGVDMRSSLAVSMPAGGVFLLLCDSLARMLAYPNHISVAVVTGIVGAVMFVFVLRK